MLAQLQRARMKRIERSLSTAGTLLTWLIEHEREQRSIERIGEHLTRCLQSGGRVLTCGNGGSMCDAMHFAEELSGRFRKDRPALAVQAMSDPAHLTCVANDWGFEHVFARGVEAWGRPGDCLLAFSTSGNSRNLLRAAEQARARGLHVIGMLGRDGGALKELCDLSLTVPGTTADRIQEVHIKIVHILIEEIERRLFPQNYDD